MELPLGAVVDLCKIAIRWLRAKFGSKFAEYPRFQTHADKPFGREQLQSLADHINKEYAGHYEKYTAAKIHSWLEVCPEIYQVVFDKVLWAEKVVGSCKVLPLSQTAINKIFAGTFESINALPEDIAPSISEAQGIWIGDLIVAKQYRVLASSSDAISKCLLFQVRTLVRPYLGKKLVFARSERDDVRRLLMNQGFVPHLREGEELTRLTPFVHLTDERKAKAFSSRQGRGQKTRRSAKPLV